jgi:hypothetical protein
MEEKKPYVSVKFWENGTDKTDELFLSSSTIHMGFVKGNHEAFFPFEKYESATRFEKDMRGIKGVVKSVLKSRYLSHYSDMNYIDKYVFRFDQRRLLDNLFSFMEKRSSKRGSLELVFEDGLRFYIICKIKFSRRGLPKIKIYTCLIKIY